MSATDVLNSVWSSETEQFAVGEAANIYESTDGGQHWTVQFSSPFDYLTGVTGRQGDVFVVGSNISERGALGSPLIHGTDANWTTHRIQPSSWASGIADSGSTLFVASDSAVMASDDAGATWRFTTAPEANYLSIAFANCGEILALGAFDTGPHIGREIIARSRDNGSSWVTLDAPEHAISLGAAGDVYLVATSAGGIFRSVDRGMTWQAALTTNAHLSSVAIDPISNGAFAVGDGSTLFYSLDAGASWAPLDIGQGLQFRAVAVYGPSRRAYAVGSSSAVLACNF